ncbi:hypothetical protein BD560DRAFT_443712 [Blakeslea trispora]|nr:hypothetical protein BD560DRAFT_443712 [Blakeslea trispora]
MNNFCERQRISKSSGARLKSQPQVVPWLRRLLGNLPSPRRLFAEEPPSHVTKPYRVMKAVTGAKARAQLRLHTLLTSEFTKSTEIVRRRAPITRYEALPCDEGGYWSKSSSPTTFACNEDGSKKKEWKKFVCIKTLSSAYVAIC